MDDPYLKLVQKTIEEYVKQGKAIPLPNNLPEEMLIKRAGVFVSIHQKDGDLRGCIGTYLPTQKNLAYEIINNAIGAAVHDHRFPRVTKAELPDLIYSVDILSEPEPTKEKDLNPKKYGLLVKSNDGRKGLLLPDIPGVGTAKQQIDICRQKAWLDKDDPIRLYRFTVERHGQK